MLFLRNIQLILIPPVTGVLSVTGGRIMVKLDKTLMFGQIYQS